MKQIFRRISTDYLILLLLAALKFGIHLLAINHYGFHRDEFLYIAKGEHLDYAGGEDFNGTLLRIALVTAFGLVVAGALLATLAARRRWRALHKARHGQARRT